MSVRGVLKLVEVLGLAEGTEEAVFLRLDGVSMLKLAASPFFMFSVPPKVHMTPLTHRAPMSTCLTGKIIFSITRHYAVYDPGI